MYFIFCVYVNLRLLCVTFQAIKLWICNSFDHFSVVRNVTFNYNTALRGNGCLLHQLPLGTLRFFNSGINQQLLKVAYGYSRQIKVVIMCTADAES
jgi:hypothetical protein